MGAATARLRDGHFELLILPVQGMSAVDLTALERDVVRDGTTFVIRTAPKAKISARASASAPCRASDADTGLR